MGPELHRNIPDLKTVDLPDREVIARKLQKLGMWGMSEQTNRFLQAVTEQFSDRTLNAEGLYMGWALASATTLADQIPLVRNAMDMYFDKVVDAIVPDAEVAEDAKAFRKKILEDLRQKAKAAEPSVDDLGPEDSLQDFERFTQALRVNTILSEYTGEGFREEETNLEELNNPYYRQTHRGFFLEYYYRSPAYLWTPWGEYRLRDDGGRFTGDEADFLGKLGATLHRPEVNKREGTIGPIYAVHSVDGVELPDPVERPRSAYKPYKEVDSAWNQMAKKYYESQQQTPPITSGEKFALDDQLIEERSRKEPPVGDDDIKELLMLSFYRGKVVKYTRDGGKTWRFTKIQNVDADYYEGVLGFPVNNEVMPNTQVHSTTRLDAQDFERGLVVRPTTPEEIRDMKFSYEFDRDREEN